MHPRPEPTPSAAVTVVIPVRDRPAALARLLASVGPTPSFVVDDASSDRVEVEKVAREAGADYIRLEAHSGPGAARNAGLARVRTALVAFVDSDCVVSPGWLEGLCGHFADPRVALVAPRIITPPGTNALARYEAARSSLDMGADPARVGPGSRVSYVPTAAVVLRRSAVGIRCFDERLAAGEDVDFVWRLVAAGWDLRYEPSVQILHGEDPRLRPWIARRALYGTTAGPLARRHPGAIAPARIPLSSLVAWALLAVRRPGAAAAATAGSTVLLASRLAGVLDDPVTLAARLTLSGMARAAVPTVAGLGRVWSPGLLAALLARRSRRLRVAAAAVLVVTILAGWRRRPTGLDPVRYVGLRLCDDLAYGAGVWWGCAVAGTVRPLVPVVTGLPWRPGQSARTRGNSLERFTRRPRAAE